MSDNWPDSFVVVYEASHGRVEVVDRLLKSYCAHNPDDSVECWAGFWQIKKWSGFDFSEVEMEILNTLENSGSPRYWFMGELQSAALRFAGIRPVGDE